MANFPSIGRLLLPGYGETPDPGVERTEMENGFVKQAQVTAAGLVEIPIVYVFTSAEYETFRGFWGDTLRRGADWFQWVNPRDGATYDVRIVGGAYRAQAYTSADGAKLSWEVEMTLEHWDDEEDD